MFYNLELKVELVYLFNISRRLTLVPRSISSKFDLGLEG